MKSFLKRRWHHLPIGIITAVLLACLVAGSAFAAYSFYNGTVEVTVSEPMTVEPYYVSGDVTWDGDNYTVDLGPGEVVRLGWDVRNHGDVPLNVKPSVSPTTADRGNITTEWVMTHDLGDGSQTVGPETAVGTAERFTLVIRANGSTAPSIYTFTVTLDRS